MATPHLPIGTTIGGKYQLLRLLGEGGMGAVYEARNELTLKRVALKVLHPTLAADEQAAARMLREAQTSSRVRHPNVVDVYDAGHEGDNVFLVMEFLEGEPLGQALKRGGMMAHDAIAYLVDAMRGVAAAHRAGVVHRDIKPDNIFLAHEGESARPVAKVLDFGVSKLLDEPSLRLTRTDATVGTPLYMSFEQLSGMRDGVDARADVYAFGVILYELLTGRPPHEANTLAQLAMLIATQDPPALRTLRPEIPARLAQAVRRAIAKYREQRTESLEVLMRELAPFTRADGFSPPLSVAAPPPASTLPPTLPAGRTLSRTANERISIPAAATAPSLPVQRRRARRALALGATLGGLLGIGALLPRRTGEPPPPPAARASASTPSKVAVEQTPPPVTPPTQVTPLEDARATVEQAPATPDAGMQPPQQAAAPEPAPRAHRERVRPRAVLKPPAAIAHPPVVTAPAKEVDTGPQADEPPARKYRAGKVDRSEF